MQFKTTLILFSTFLCALSSATKLPSQTFISSYTEQPKTVCGDHYACGGICVDEDAQTGATCSLRRDSARGDCDQTENCLWIQYAEQANPQRAMEEACNADFTCKGYTMWDASNGTPQCLQHWTDVCVDHDRLVNFSNEREFECKYNPNFQIFPELLDERVICGVDCAGSYGACDENCQKTYTVTQIAFGTGKACPASPVACHVDDAEDDACVPWTSSYTEQPKTVCGDHYACGGICVDEDAQTGATCSLRRDSARGDCDQTENCLWIQYAEQANPQRAMEEACNADKTCKGYTVWDASNGTPQCLQHWTDVCLEHDRLVNFSNEREFECKYNPNFQIFPELLDERVICGVDCAGSYGACDENCQKTYTVTQIAFGTGKACPASPVACHVDDADDDACEPELPQKDECTHSLVSESKFCGKTAHRDSAGQETFPLTFNMEGGKQASAENIALAAKKCEELAKERALNEHIINFDNGSEVFTGKYYFEMRPDQGVFCVPVVRCQEQDRGDAWWSNLYELTCPMDEPTAKPTEQPTAQPTENIVVPTCASKDADLFVELVSESKFCGKTAHRDYAGEETKVLTVNMEGGAQASAENIALAAAKCEALALERAQNEHIIGFDNGSEVYNGHYYFEMRPDQGVWCIPPVRCQEEDRGDAWWSNLYEFTCEDEPIVEPTCADTLEECMKFERFDRDVSFNGQAWPTGCFSYHDVGSEPKVYYNNGPSVDFNNEVGTAKERAERITMKTCENKPVEPKCKNEFWEDQPLQDCGSHHACLAFSGEATGADAEHCAGIWHQGLPASVCKEDARCVFKSGERMVFAETWQECAEECSNDSELLGGCNAIVRDAKDGEALELGRCWLKNACDHINRPDGLRMVSTSRCADDLCALFDSALCPNGKIDDKDFVVGNDAATCCKPFKPVDNKKAVKKAEKAAKKAEKAEKKTAKKEKKANEKSEKQFKKQAEKQGKKDAKKDARNGQRKKARDATAARPQGRRLVVLQRLLSQENAF